MNKMTNMIDGIKVLSVHEYYRPTVATIVCIIAIFLAITAYAVIKNKWLMWLISSFLLFVIFILGMNNELPNKLEKKFETEYEVLIEDTVSFKNFDENYRIVNTNGEIYTIKEK